MKLLTMLATLPLAVQSAPVVTVDGQNPSVALTYSTNIWNDRNYKYSCIPPEYLGKTHIFQTSHDGMYNKMHMTASEQVDWYILVRVDYHPEHGDIPQSAYVSSGKLVKVDGPVWDLGANFHPSDPLANGKTEVYKWTDLAGSTDLTIDLPSRLTGAIMWTLPGAVSEVTKCTPTCGDPAAGKQFKSGKTSASTCTTVPCPTECFEDRALQMCGAAPAGKRFKSGKTSTTGCTDCASECFEADPTCGALPAGKRFKSGKTSTTSCTDCAIECFEDIPTCGPEPTGKQFKAGKSASSECSDCASECFESEKSSCTVSTWGSITLASSGTATVNLGASTATAPTGLQIPAIKYNYASCVANNKVKIKAYKFDASSMSCDTTKPVLSGVTFDTKSFAGKPQSKTELTTGIKINGPNLAALQTGNGLADATNTVEICLKATIEHNNKEIISREDVVSVSYKPKLAFSGATAASVGISRAAAHRSVDEDVEALGDIAVFRCDANSVAYTEASAPVINQANPFVRICVHGQTPEVQCDKFWVATVTQDLTGGKLGAASENRVANGAVLSAFDGITSIAGIKDVGPMNARHKGCVFEAMLSTDYFKSTTPGAVDITGEVFMSFKAASSRGRRLGDGRKLQDEASTPNEEAPASNETPSSFDIVVPLGETQRTNTADRTSFIATAGLIMTAAAHCIV